MAILAVDSFTRADADPLGGNWAPISGVPTLQVLSNSAQPDSLFSTTVNREVNAGASWPNNQYAQVTLSLLAANLTDNYGGVGVRTSVSSDDGYFLFLGNAADPNAYLQKVVSGTRTTLSSIPYTFNANDVIKLEVQGTSLSALLNGSVFLTATDSTFASGSAAILGLTTDATFDSLVEMVNWVGGDFLAPVPASLSQSSAAQSATVATFTVTGTHFDADGGSTISFSGSGITVNSYSSRSATQIVANITISAGAALTARDVIVTNPSDGQTGTLAASFTVTGTPAPASINPTSGTQGTSLNVTVSGTNFDLATGSTISFSGSGITVNSYSVQNGTTITANISISAGAAATARDVIVTNPDGGATGTLSSAFTVISASHGISGNAGVAGATVSWSGTSSGSTTADGSGNYNTGEVLANGPYTITPSKTNYTFSPVNSSQTVSGADITGVNFTATFVPPGSRYSVPDCRVPPYGPNASRDVQGTLTYDVQTSSNPAVPGVDSRVNKPVDSRIAPNIPENSRAPGVYGPGE